MEYMRYVVFRVIRDTGSAYTRDGRQFSYMAGKVVRWPESDVDKVELVERWVTALIVQWDSPPQYD